MGRMLDLYTWRTPNGKKAPILLAELGWPFDLHLVNLGQGDQRKPEYLAINPNGKIPALIDTEGVNSELVVVFESGAILEYLADKAGRFLPKEQPGRAEVLSWTYWRVGGPTPFFSQLSRLRRAEAAQHGSLREVLRRVAAARSGARRPSARSRVGRRRVLDRGHHELPMVRRGRGAPAGGARGADHVKRWIGGHGRASRGPEGDGRRVGACP